MSNITLELKARHFENTVFSGCGMCAIEKAVYEVFGTNNVQEGVWDIDINKETYTHEYYGYDDFIRDKQQAADLNYSDAVIRTITLVKQ